MLGYIVGLIVLCVIVTIFWIMARHECDALNDLISVLMNRLGSKNCVILKLQEEIRLLKEKSCSPS